MSVDHPVDALRQRARAQLEANTRYAERAGRRFTYSVPSARSYPFQWFWDSCFHAIVWSQFDAERAADELRGLFAWQRADGFIPHVIFWDRRLAMQQYWHYLESAPWLAVPWLPTTRGKPATSELVQPPVLAQAVERVVSAGAAAGAGAGLLREAVPVLLRYHRWLLATRDPDDDGLISILAPPESGLDYSPVFDTALGLGRDPDHRQLGVAMRLATLLAKRDRWSPARRARGWRAFTVEDVLVNSCLVAGLEATARLARAAGESGGAAWAEAQAARTLAALIARCYDAEAGAFRNLDGVAERPAPVLAIGALMPLMLDGLPQPIADAIVERQLTRSGRFAARYAVPSVAIADQEFRADSRPGGAARLWRGGTWINTNWWLVHGLRRHGFAAEADAIAQASRDLVARHGFREYYNPLTGEPGGAEGFGWSTLVIDM